MGPLCFVLMPFGSKPDPTGRPNIDFDRIYKDAIKLGVEDAGMFPLRADEEKLGGIIHKQMFERLLVYPFAVADLTTCNPNVMYELGIRHAARPRTTLTIYAASTPLPFDLNLLRTQPYHLEANNQLSHSAAAELRQAIAGHLRHLSDLADLGQFIDSPLFQLVTELEPKPLLPATMTFSDEKVKDNEKLKEQLRELRREASADGEQRSSLLDRLAKIRADVLAVEAFDVGVLTEIMRTYRALESWSGMIDIYDVMPDALKQQVLVRQQLAFAYNRRAEISHQPDDRAQALAILEALQDEQGYNPETCGLIGRIYKSRWQEAVEAHETVNARRFLDKAIDAYVHGFAADWRDVYPGVNAVTLLDAQGDDGALRRKEKLMPVVRFAAERNCKSANPTYWDYATILELAVHAGEVDRANEAMDNVLSADAEAWQPETTARNLRIIEDRSRQRGEDVAWIAKLVEQLDAAAGCQALS